MKDLQKILVLMIVWITTVSCGDSDDDKPPVETPTQNLFTSATAVNIQGYEGTAMEPFISPDGQFLFFNNSPEESQSDLHYAALLNSSTFEYRGRLTNANSNSYDGIPSIDGQGILYFASLRSSSTLFSGSFENGTVSNIDNVRGVNQSQLDIAAFDGQITADGSTFYFSSGNLDGVDLPDQADLFVADLSGGSLSIRDNSDFIMQNINTGDLLEYSPSISSDELELFYTRMLFNIEDTLIQVLRANRVSTDSPFEPPRVVGAIVGSEPEAPSISSDGRTLYFHRRDLNGDFGIFVVTRDDP